MNEMKRICPFCKTELTASSHHFCEYCGSELPEELYLKPEEVVFEKEPFLHNEGVKISEKSAKKDTSLNKVSGGISIRSIVGGILLGMSISTMIFLATQTDFLKLFSIKKGDKKPLVINLERSDRKNVSEESASSLDIEVKENYRNLGLNLQSGVFGQKDIYSYIPFDFSLYIEISDPETFDPYFSFLGGEFFTLAESLKGKIHPSYSAFYMKRGLSSGWVLIAFPTDTFLEISGNRDIAVDKEGDAILISYEPELIDQVKLAKSEIEKNMAIHPSFVKIKNVLPKEGQVFLLKKSGDGDIVIDETIRNTLSEEFKSILNTFKESEDSYLVIK